MKRTSRKTISCENDPIKNKKYQVNTESAQSISESKLHKEAHTCTYNTVQALTQSIVPVLINHYIR